MDRKLLILIKVIENGLYQHKHTPPWMYHICNSVISGVKKHH